MSKPDVIRRALLSETFRNIDSIAKQINEGKVADKDLMIKLINRMLAFLNEFVKLPEKPGKSTDTATMQAVEGALGEG